MDESERSFELTTGSLHGVIRDVLSPLVESDGGSVRLVAFDDGIVTLALDGACAGCPGTNHTLQYVLLPALRRADGAVREVRLAPRTA